jgi:hypothetical protein
MIWKLPKPISGTGGKKVYATSKHDLEWLGDTYNRIVAACARKESRVGPARGK